MPSKKKKYNARFPPARIKKIMQTDEDVGKVAAAVPVIISRALELFIESLILKANETTKSKNAKTLSAQHLKQTVLAEREFDFLKDLVATIPDVQPNEDEADIEVSRPQDSAPRPRGRPRKKKGEEGDTTKKEKSKKSSTDDSATEEGESECEEVSNDEDHENTLHVDDRVGEEVEKVGEKMERIVEEMEIVGEEMDRVGKEMDRVAEEAEMAVKKETPQLHMADRVGEEVKMLVKKETPQLHMADRVGEEVKMVVKKETPQLHMADRVGEEVEMAAEKEKENSCEAIDMTMAAMSNSTSTRSSTSSTPFTVHKPIPEPTPSSSSSARNYSFTDPATLTSCQNTSC